MGRYNVSPIQGYAMINGKFAKEDKEKVIEFLNRVAKHAKFSDMSTNELIDYYKSLAYMQTTLLPKIEHNILEVVRVVEEEKVKKE
jgi:hypothetical protein